MKAATLLLLLQKDPQEFIDRLLTFAESRAEKPHGKTSPEIISTEQEIYAHCPDIGQFIQEAPLSEIRSHVTSMQSQISKPLSGVAHDANFSLATFCYAWCRKHKPSLVIETGVGHGVTSAFILQALAVNQSGELWSVDLPPLGSEKLSGCFVRDAIKNRWRLERGRSRRVLPKLLREARTIDMFLHDSLHTAKNMNFEFSSAWPCIKKGGLLISDDATFFNNAFQEFVSKNDCSYSAIHPSGFGIAIKNH